MEVTVNVDGACEPINPEGIASYGFVVRKQDEEILKEGMTNNVAEYTAAIKGLEWVADNLDPSEVTKVTLQGDSELIIKQITGEYAVKSQRLSPLHEELREVIDDLCTEFEARWVPREQNEGADALSKDAVSEYVQSHDYRFNGYPLVECDECGAWMVVRSGDYGKFYGCTRYPKCENTRSLEEVEGED